MTTYHQHLGTSQQYKMKCRFNELLAKYKRAEVWFAREDIPYQQKLKYESTVAKMLSQISKLVIALGLKEGDIELREGFDLREVPNEQMAIV